MRAYKYFFYTVLRWQRRLWPNDMPEINAFYFTIMVTWWSLYVLVMIAECSFGVRLLPELAKWQVLLAVAGLALALYFLLLYRKGAQKITTEFEGESARKARLHGRIVFAYIVISFALLPIMAIIRGKVLPHP